MTDPSEPLAKPVATDAGNVVYPAAFRRILPPTPVEIKELRAKLRMTQQTFAQTFGFHLETLRKWEQGRATPEQSNVILLRLIMVDALAMQDMLDTILTQP